MRRLLHLRLQPLAALGVRDVHELDPDAAAVDGARCVGKRAFERGGGKRLRREVLVEGIECGLEVSPAAEDVEDRVALGFGLGGCGGYGGRALLGGGGHQILRSIPMLARRR